MVSASNPFFLPVADEAIEKGYVELLRAGFADKPLFVSLNRRVFDAPDKWGRVLAKITLNLATLYSAEGELSEDALVAITDGYHESLGNYLALAASKTKAPAKGKTKGPAKGLTMTPAKAKAKAKAKAAAPAKLKARAKPASKSAKSAARSAGKAMAGRKGARKA